MLASAQAPEDPRGVSRARLRSRDAGADGGGRRTRRGGRRVRRGGNGRVPAGTRRFLLVPRDEYPAPGGASRHRDGDRSGSRAGPARHRGRGRAADRAGPGSADRPRDRMPDLGRGPRARVRSVDRQDPRVRRAGGTGNPCRQRGRGRERSDAALRPPAAQGRRARPRPRGGAGEDGARAGRAGRRRDTDERRLPARGRRASGGAGGPGPYALARGARGRGARGRGRHAPGVGAAGRGAGRLARGGAPAGGRTPGSGSGRPRRALARGRPLDRAIVTEQAAGPAAGDAVELEVERIAYGGDGVGRADGLVVFVPWTAPGERVRARIVERHPRYARARLEGVLAAADARVEPGCPVFGICGGCQLQHLDRDAQLASKARAVADAFERIAGTPLAAPLACEHAAGPWHYRRRATFTWRRSKGMSAFGFHAADDPGAIVDVDGCPIFAERGNAALAGLKEALADAPPADGDAPEEARIAVRALPGQDAQAG